LRKNKKRVANLIHPKKGGKAKKELSNRLPVSAGGKKIGMEVL